MPRRSKRCGERPNPYSILPASEILITTANSSSMRATCQFAGPSAKAKRSLAGITADDLGELCSLSHVQLRRRSTAQLGLEFAYSTLRALLRPPYLVGQGKMHDFIRILVSPRNESIYLCRNINFTPWQLSRGLDALGGDCSGLTRSAISNYDNRLP